MRNFDAYDVFQEAYHGNSNIMTPRVHGCAFVPSGKNMVYEISSGPGLTRGSHIVGVTVVSFVTDGPELYEVTKEFDISKAFPCDEFDEAMRQAQDYAKTL